ncbi:Tyrosinase, partial [Apiospora aurea]
GDQHGKYQALRALRALRAPIHDTARADETARDLHILGLSEMQNASESDPLSYFQIAGIHGRPFIPWNGVENITAAPFNGFCPHGNTPFTAWHRPFMALYEQTLGDHIQVLASQYNDSSSAAYKAAAESFRAPFWDWAADYRLPASVMEQLITVNGPHGTVDIPNPLYSYKWQQYPLSTDPDYFPKDGREDCYGWNETKRRPDSNGKDQYNIVNGNLAGIAGLKDQVVRLQCRVLCFFLLPAPRQRRSPLCHVAGHQLQQHLPNAVARDGGTVRDTGRKRDGRQPAEAILSGDDPTSFHTGKTVAAMATFGYTYPEIDDWSLSREGTRKAVITQVNQLYGDGANGTSSSAQQQQQRRRGRANRSLRRRQQQQQQQQQQAHATKGYFAQISVERAELQLPCTIFVMLGDDKAGQMSLLSMPTSGITHAEVPLTRALGRVLASDTAAAPAASAASATKNNNALISDAKFVASTLSQLFRVEIRKVRARVSQFFSLFARRCLLVLSHPVSVPQPDLSFFLLHPKRKGTQHVHAVDRVHQTARDFSPRGELHADRKTNARADDAVLRPAHRAVPVSLRVPRRRTCTNGVAIGADHVLRHRLTVLRSLWTPFQASRSRSRAKMSSRRLASKSSRSTER